MADFGARMKPAQKRNIAFFLRKFSKFLAVTLAFNIPAGDDQTAVTRQILRCLQDFVASFAVVKATEIANLNNFARGLSPVGESLCI